MTVLPLGFLGDFVSGGRSNKIGVIPARFRLWRNNETIKRMSFNHSVRIIPVLSLEGKDCRLDGETEEKLAYREKSPSQAFGSFSPLIVLASRKSGN